MELIKLNVAGTMWWTLALPPSNNTRNSPSMLLLEKLSLLDGINCNIWSFLCYMEVVQLDEARARMMLWLLAS